MTDHDIFIWHVTIITSILTFLSDWLIAKILSFFNLLRGMIDQHVVGHLDSNLFQSFVDEFPILQLLLNGNLVDAMRIPKLHVANRLVEGEPWIDEKWVQIADGYNTNSVIEGEPWIRKLRVMMY